MLTTNLIHLLSDRVDDLMLAIMTWVLVWGRLWHVFIYNFSYYRSHPVESFFFWQGGMSFIGWFIGVTVSLYIIMRLYKLSRRDLFILSDMIMVVLPLGIALGRFGNFLNQELVWVSIITLHQNGRIWIANTLQSLGLTYIYPRIDQLERVNTNALSIILEGLLLWIIIIITYLLTYAQKVYRPWLLTGIFMTGYCIIRFMLEYLRQDSNLEFIWLLTISQYYLIIGGIIGILFMITSKKATLP